MSPPTRLYLLKPGLSSLLGSLLEHPGRVINSYDAPISSACRRAKRYEAGSGTHVQHFILRLQLGKIKQSHRQRLAEDFGEIVELGCDDNLPDILRALDLPWRTRRWSSCSAMPRLRRRRWRRLIRIPKLVAA